MGAPTTRLVYVSVDIICTERSLCDLISRTLPYFTVCIFVLIVSRKLILFAVRVCSANSFLYINIVCHARLRAYSSSYVVFTCYATTMYGMLTLPSG